MAVATFGATVGPVPLSCPGLQVKLGQRARCTAKSRRCTCNASDCVLMKHFRMPYMRSTVPFRCSTFVPAVARGPARRPTARGEGGRLPQVWRPPPHRRLQWLLMMMEQQQLPLRRRRLLRFARRRPARQQQSKMWFVSTTDTTHQVLATSNRAAGPPRALRGVPQAPTRPTRHKPTCAPERL